MVPTTTVVDNAVITTLNIQHSFANRKHTTNYSLDTTDFDHTLDSFIAKEPVFALIAFSFLILSPALYRCGPLASF